jgi:prepilin-type N-terminal cleavage/methylation domain-containing protein
LREAWKRRRPTSEQGFTLIELLVTMMMSLIVLGVPMIWVMTSLTQENVTASRALSASQAEAGLSQLTRDLREVVPGTTATSTLAWGSTGATATLILPAGTQGSSTETVSWTCSFGSGGSCVRQVGSGVKTIMIRNVESLTFAPVDASGSPLVSTAQNPAYVGITLTVQDTNINNSTQSAPEAGAKPIVLADGADLANNTP